MTAIPLVKPIIQSNLHGKFFLVDATASEEHSDGFIVLIAIATFELYFFVEFIM